jgi:ribonuclease P protein component
MVSAPAWPPGVDARSSRHVAPRAGCVSAPDSRYPLTGARTQGFPRAVRLTGPAQYRRVFSDAKRVSDAGFTLLVRENGGPGPRLGLAISRKCARRAVDRQRIKRIIRESFRRHRGQIAPVDIVIMCRAAVLEWDNERIRSSLDRFWARLSVSCESP